MQPASSIQSLPPSSVKPVERHPPSAIELYRQGRWSEAIRAYHQAIAADPQNSSLRFYLGVVYHQQGRLAHAVTCYRQAIALQPNYPDAHSNLGCALLKQGEVEAAMHLFQDAIARYPDQADLYNNLGQALQSQGHLDEAIGAYQRALQIQPDLIQPHVSLGGLWQEQKQYAKAIAAFRRVIQLDPTHIAAHSRCGQIALAQGQWARAVSHWQDAIALQPLFVEAFCHRVQSHLPSDALDQAKATCAQFLQALRHRAQPSEIVGYLAQTYRRLGSVVLEYGGLQQAETYFRQAIQLQPTALDSYLQLGDCLALQHRLDAALMVYHVALTQWPHHPDLNSRLGSLLQQQQRVEQAIGYFQRALAAGDGRRNALPASPELSDPGDRRAHLRSTVPSVREAGGSEPRATPTSQSPSHGAFRGRIYRSTQDWVRATALEQVRYRSIDWDEPSHRRERDRTPDAACIEVTDASYAAFRPSSCGGVTCQRCMARLRDEFEPVQCCTGVYRCMRETPVAVDPHETFVVTIPQGRVWIAPQQNSWMICNSMAVLTPDGALLSDLSRDYPWYLPGCDRHHPAHHRLLRLQQLPPVERIDGRVAILSGLSGHVYYHWMVDVLPRFELLQRSQLDLTEIDYFVVNNISQPFQQQTLEMLGIPKEKLIVSDRHPHIQASTCIVPSFPGHLDWVASGTLKFLRHTFCPSSRPDSPISPSPPRPYLYISRSQARYRQVLNEAEVIEYLRPYGFVPIVLESLSVQEQIALFAQAQVVVAPHGAGLTNILFCQPGTRILELTSPHYIRTDYWIISQQLGLTHYFIKGEGFACEPLRQVMYQNPLTEDIVIPRQYLQAALQHLGL